MCLFNHQQLKEIRVYCECYEQGIYLLNYIKDNRNLKNVSKKIIYTKPGKFSQYYSKSLISQIMAHKNFDGLISIININNTEHPLVGIEFSSAVPTDDHILQRFDVMYWSTFYQIPCIKISPTKMVNTNFGGGTKVKIQHEYYATLNMKGVYYHIDWPLIDNTDLVVTDDSMISCPPKMAELKQLLNGFFDSYCNSKNDSEYFNLEFAKYKKYVTENYKDDLLDMSNSSRLQFEDNNEMTLKFNRFGHGMDPERGMLVFWAQRISKKPKVKFIVQRENQQKYYSLYEKNNIEYIMNVICNDVLPNNNIVTLEIAFDLFKKATNTELLFSNSTINGKTIMINDSDLLEYLAGNVSVINNLLHFGEKILLNNLNDEIIVEIKWNNNIVDDFYHKLKQKSLSIEKQPLPLEIISNSSINEDVITYACMSLFMMSNMKNIAVSYPGAQGDRKLLQGSGRNVKRDYVDIISIQKVDENGYNVFLQENKKKISETQKSDIDKLYSIKTDANNREELSDLIRKVYHSINIKGYYIGVGGQESHLSQGETRFDYLMYIMINSEKNIDWQILSSNSVIFKIFKDIANNSGTLKGTIKLEYQMYVVN